MVEGSNSSTHPPLPPTTEDAWLDWLRLLRSRRVGPVTFHRMMVEHGSAADALRALPEIARAAGIDNYAICPEGVARAELKSARTAGARPLFYGCAGYPQALVDLADAPPILWAIGDVSLLSRPMTALIGARSASSLGTRMARKLAKDLGTAGEVIVSGLARGVDAASHAAALDTGTIAVLAGGVDVFYPAENADLARAIARTGLLLSEQPIGMQPQARHFPARNRIVSGLSRAVVVVEAAARSGSLITARLALEQGREVMAVPGHPMDARAAGCNMLIRDGALLVRSAADVTEALGPAPASAVATPTPAPAAGRAHTPTPTEVPASDATPRRPRRLRAIAELHRQILARLGPSPMAEDQLIRDLEIGPEQVAPALTDLELDGKIARQPGGLLSRPS
ncbi:DNA-processing protein DprA [Roseisalinus antarcticus]|uniref:Uncharacterized protein n=1 Tax=Roseisalinus antarcticus TaxID=254357 RepID=A0A1Y5SZK3_9RHOB|nr:DNA-processing protein DprA [Roseisalinus antarcticus]SLN50518.1 hypothetical protein ROA7023_02188 [Roseisalinus antarcticus]